MIPKGPRLYQQDRESAAPIHLADSGAVPPKIKLLGETESIASLLTRKAPRKVSDLFLMETQSRFHIWVLHYLTWQLNDRRGRLAVPKSIPKTAPATVRLARERTLAVHGARMFNLLPKNLRNENSGDFALFKNNLDIYLTTIPDQPTTPSLVRAAKTSSLVEQVPLCNVECKLLS